MNLKQIDPALNSLKEFTKITGGSPRDIQGMREKYIYRDGSLPSKVKVLFSLLWSISEKCEPCIKYYAQRSKSLGVTVEEIGELLAVASTMGGCVGEMWALKAFSAFENNSAETETCCS